MSAHRSKSRKVTVHALRKMKETGDRIAMLTAYDATYVVLAAVLRAPLLTCDAKLAAAAANAARVELVPN